MSGVVQCYCPRWIYSCFCPDREIDVRHAPSYFMPSSLSDKKISELFIAFSHNTYIDDRRQILAYATVEEVVQSILNGTRGIELDIWDKNDDDSTPVVTHAERFLDHSFQASLPIDFEKFIEKIAEYSWVKSDLPLFICLELNAKADETKERIAAILENHLSDRFFDSSLFPSLGEVVLNDLKNKVVFIANDPEHQKLRSVIHYIFGRYVRNIGYNDMDRYTDLAEFNRRHFTRIYPNNLFLGRNPDPLPAFERGCTAMTMNVNFQDDHLKTYREIFKDFPIVLKESSADQTR